MFQTFFYDDLIKNLYDCFSKDGESGRYSKPNYIMLLLYIKISFVNIVYYLKELQQT